MENLKEILELHSKWLNGYEGGKEANLHNTDLSGVDLSNADLHYVDLSNTNLSNANLNNANLYGTILRDADLSGTNLSRANLHNASLRYADLRGANIDFSSWPLWCGGLHVKTDKRIACQLAYHFCSLDCDDKEYIAARNSILTFANQFHRVQGCGILKEI